MKISESSIDLSSSHTLVEKHVERESLNVWGNEKNIQAIERNQKDDILSIPKESNAIITDTVSLSQPAVRARSRKTNVTPMPEDQRYVVDLNLQILRNMIERITGKVLDVRIPREKGAVEPIEDDIPREVVEGQASAIDEQGFGMEYTYFESHYEYEATGFQGIGIILMEDGAEIDFSVELKMSREFMSENQFKIQVGEPLKDPLVINFSGNAAEITSTKFSFDIDADGQEDQIGFVGPNSGFLALDLNGNEQIDNGLELFGPKSGDGFLELAAYDSDNNQWIDENDPIYNKLRIWTKNEKGENQLFALGERGIGAIYVNHIESPFSINDAENNTLGKIRDSSVVINEDGTVGTIQQIDIAV